MKIIKTTLIEFNNITGILLFPEEGIWDSEHPDYNKDIDILVTSDGIIYKENDIKKFYIYDKQLVSQILSNSNFKHKYNLTEYDRFKFDELEQYTNDEEFMKRVASFLNTNATFTKIRMAEALGIEKKIVNKLVAYLIENKFVTTYFSYFKVII